MFALLLFAATLGQAASAIPPGTKVWGFAEWGMAQEQVIAASGGQAVVSEVRPAAFGSGQCTLSMTAPVVAAGYSFAARFCFTGGQLTTVELENSGPDGFQIDLALAGTYGQPAFANGLTRIYVGDDMTVRYVSSDGRNRLIYSPRASGL